VRTHPASRLRLIAAPRNAHTRARSSKVRQDSAGRHDALGMTRRTSHAARSSPRSSHE
jgi:hypothetical protein